MTAFLQATVGSEEGLVGPSHHVRSAGGDDVVAAGAGVRLIPAAQIAHSEVGPTGTGLGARHGGEAVHAQGNVPLPVRALVSAACHAPITSHPAPVPKPGMGAGCDGGSYEPRESRIGRSGRPQPLTDPAMSPPTKYLPSRM